jgi:hypothetical protein
MNNAMGSLSLYPTSALQAPDTVINRKSALGQPDCIFRLGGPCSLTRNSAWFAGGQGVSQFSCMLLLVLALMLTACFGVAAWRISGDGEDVTGSTSPASIHLR